MSEDLRRLGWRELALRFLDSFNPKLNREIIVVNAVVDYDGPLPETHLRYHAHSFVRAAAAMIEQEITPSPGEECGDWLKEWVRRNL